jgi:hypothetical protein
MSTQKLIMGIPEKRTVGTARRSLLVIPPFMFVIIICCCIFLIFPVQAELVKGTYYQILSVDQPPQANATVFYFNNITPKNDPKEWRVNPGDTIYLGGTYDLSYVMGVSKQFAWWKDWKYESTDCSPDLVNTVSYIQTNGRINSKMVYIDPEQYKIGNWWQWDGCYIDRTDRSGIAKWLPYKADNNLAFRIIYPPVWPPVTPTPIPTPEITAKFTRPITTVATPTIIPELTPIRDTGMPGWIWGLIIGGIILLIIIFVVVL